MAITEVPITGNVSMPDGTAFTSGVLSFTLSGPDAELAAAIPGGTIKATLGALGAMPDGFVLWRNTAGDRGTYYKVSLSAVLTQPSGTPYRQTYPMGSVQVGDEASYSIGDLLRSPVPDAPGWYLYSLGDGELDTSVLDLSDVAGSPLKATDDGDDIEAYEIVFEEPFLDADLVDETISAFVAAPDPLNWPDSRLGWSGQTGKITSSSLAGNVSFLAMSTLTGEFATRFKNDGTWSPWNVIWHVYAKNFGAKEDYDQTTGLALDGSPANDDFDAIQAALDYAATTRGGITGGYVIIGGRSYYDGVLELPRGVGLIGMSAVSSVGQGQTDESTYPFDYGEGSGLVAAHTSGPAILCGSSNNSVIGLTIGATEARKAAAISSGGQNRNAGILVEPTDSSTGNLQRTTIRDVLIRDQPADAVHICGDVFGTTIERLNYYNCAGHGIIADDGTVAGRTNKARPGETMIMQCRGNNIGGHGIAIGSPSAASTPYRTTIIGTEDFRIGNDAAVRFKSSGWYLAGEQVTVIGSAPSGVSGYTGSVATLDYSVWISGRNVHLEDCRFVNFVANGASIGLHSALGTRDISMNGIYVSTTATHPDYAVNVEDVVRGIFIQGMSGDFNTAPLNAATVQAINAAGYGYYIYEGVRQSWNWTDDDPIQHVRKVAGTTVLQMTSTYSYIPQPIRMVANATMPSGFGTPMINIPGTGSSNSHIGVLRTSADSGGGGVKIGKQRSGFNQLTSGDDLGWVDFLMPDGASAMVQAAQILAEAASSANPYGKVTILTRGATAALVAALAIDEAQRVSAKGLGGLGYGTGAGGSVSQGTSRTTGVTLNAACGGITMFSAAGSATAATFTVTNSVVSSTDTIILNQKNGTNLYSLHVTKVQNGSFDITFYTTGGTATDAPVINFAVIKAEVT